MLKYGSFVLKDETRDELQFVWNLDMPTVESVDFLYDLSAYNYINTTNCEAAYFNKSKELYYGRVEIIKAFFKCKNEATAAKGEFKQVAEIKDGAAFITQSKVNDALGIAYKIVMRNGVLVSEYYETAEAVIHITDYDYNRYSYVAPINLNLYTAADVSNLVVSDASSTADYYSLDYLRKKYPWIDEIDTRDYCVPTSLEEARKRLKEWAESPNKLKGMDIETTGLNVYMGGEDVITGVVMASSETNSTYYCFRQEAVEYNLPISFLEEIVETVNSQPEDTLIIWHGARFDLQGFRKECTHYVQDAEAWKSWKSKYDKYPDDRCANGTKLLLPRCDRDSLVLSMLVNPIVARGTHTLKALTFKATGQRHLELDMIFKGEIRFNVLPAEYIKLYACADPCSNIIVYKYLIDQLPKSEMKLYTDVECPLVKLKAEQEFYGLNTNRERLNEEINKKDYEFKTLGELFRQFHKTSSNINSPQVLREILYNQLRAPVEVRTSIGYPSTSKVAVKRICELGAIKPSKDQPVPPPIKGLSGNVVIKGEELIANKYPSLIILSKYNEVKKELGALKRLAKHSCNGRIMFYINQNGAASGRQTSDAHQFSNGMKSVVISDSPEHTLISCDYKQVELRILAYLAGQQDLIDLMNSSSLVDIHRAILSTINGIPMWSITDKMRKLGKATNFGVVYMMSGVGLAKRRSGPGFTKQDLIDATNSITDFYNGLPNIKKFTAANEQFVREKGYITTAFGRHRYFREILDPEVDNKRVASMVRAANNTPVQGFGADMLKLGEVMMHKYIHDKGWDELVLYSNGQWLPKVRLMLPIHDENLVSYHDSVPTPEVMKMLRDCMELEMPGAPHFYAAPAFIPCWLDGKDDAYEVPIPFRDEIIARYEKDGTCLLDMEHYLDCLNAYRNQDLANYMEPLIAKYKTPEEVGLHVRDDVYTHILISTYKNKKEDKDLSHEEIISACARRYMESNQRNANFSGLEEQEETTEERLESFEQLEEFIQIDNNGEAIISEIGELEKDVYDRDELDSSHLNKEVVDSYSFFFMNECWVDLSCLGNTDKGDAAHRRIMKLCEADGDYKLFYLIGNKRVPTGRRIKYLPQEIDTIINEIRRSD